MIAMETIVRALTGSDKTKRFTFNEIDSNNLKQACLSADWIICQKTKITEDFIKTPKYENKLIEVPILVSNGFNSDCIYLSDTSVKSPIVYHSMIVASAFRNGISSDKCRELFSPAIYDALGYAQRLADEDAQIRHMLAAFGIDTSLVDRWRSKGRIMYTLNHPKMFVLEDIVKDVFYRKNISHRKIDCWGTLADPLINHPVFPSYIDHSTGHHYAEEDIFFKKGNGEFISLENFIDMSYQIYEGAVADGRSVDHKSFADGGLDRQNDIFSRHLSSKTSPKRPVTPYSKLDDFRFWKRSITNVAARDVDPVVKSDIRVRGEDKVATAGSCFAQHIARRLHKAGFNHFVAEPSGGDGQPMFSARYGNIYTVGQLLQLFEAAFTISALNPPIWQRPDGRYVDSLRPSAFEDGFRSQEEVKSERDHHLAKVRQMFEELDVFVFTLGLTEAWIHNRSGSILPIAPGVVAGEYDPTEYSFKNFSLSECQSQMNSFIRQLQENNPTARIILTVSPVPLAATFEDRHVLISTTSSKSALRVLAELTCAKNENVSYFPSYEIITGNFNRCSYYKDNLREINEDGVDHVMKLFMKHCTDGEYNTSKYIGQDLEEIEEVLCDEALIEA